MIVISDSFGCRLNAYLFCKKIVRSLEFKE